VNIQKLNAHALAGHVSHLRFDEHDSLFEGQAGNQLNLVASLERCRQVSLDEHTAYAEVVDLLYAFETSDDNVKVKLDPRSQSLLFLRLQAL
jgi:hypothetical protein